MNRGITAIGDDFGGLRLRGSNDSAMLDSIYPNQIVCNLSAPKNYIKMSLKNIHMQSKRTCCNWPNETVYIYS